LQAVVAATLIVVDMAQCFSTVCRELDAFLFSPTACSFSPHPDGLAETGSRSADVSPSTFLLSIASILETVCASGISLSSSLSVAGMASSAPACSHPFCYSCDDDGGVPMQAVVAATLNVLDMAECVSTVCRELDAFLFLPAAFSFVPQLRSATNGNARSPYTHAVSIPFSPHPDGPAETGSRSADVNIPFVDRGDF
jgi:hypothetical protein